MEVCQSKIVVVDDDVVDDVDDDVDDDGEVARISHSQQRFPEIRLLTFK
jgi:hypothetical protein